MEYESILKLTVMLIAFMILITFLFSSKDSENRRIPPRIKRGREHQFQGRQEYG